MRTITQFQGDSKPTLPTILAGQNSLADLLIYSTSLLLVSRVVARNHLAGVSLQDMQVYFLHHLKIAGVKQNLFSDPAVTAIQQNSGGLFRRANHLARGTIIAAAEEHTQVVSPEHVRIASTEFI
ncbi:AAA family ATPase [Desulfarculales bacterium]